MLDEITSLLGAVWPHVPPAIVTARSWGGDWFEVSTPFVVRHEGRIVAHAGVVHCQLVIGGESRTIPAIHGVCVHPDCRGRGYARQVLESALGHLDRQGAESVILWSEKVELYDRFGFTPTPESIFVGPAPAARPTRARGCDLASRDDRAWLRAALRTREPVSSMIAAADDGWHFLIDLALWTEAVGIPSEALVALLPDHRGAMVYEVDGTVLRIYDYVGEALPSAAELVGAAESLSGVRTESIEVFFTPDRLDVTLRPQPGPDEDLLLVRGQPLLEGTRPFALSPLTRT